mmetsp:Transcript_10717/g.27204  ORF Transcript_10717/g.27204 Transcript_10717/m.27204 type:complete len:220 (-) Transcript_10717:142-801(-)
MGRGGGRSVHVGVRCRHVARHRLPAVEGVQRADGDDADRERHGERARQDGELRVAQLVVQVRVRALHPARHAVEDRQQLAHGAGRAAPRGQRLHGRPLASGKRLQRRQRARARVLPRLAGGRDVEDGGVALHTEARHQHLLQHAVDLPDPDRNALLLHPRRQLLPHGLQRFAVHTPRRVHLDHPRLARRADQRVEVFIREHHHALVRRPRARAPRGTLP